jgi:replicative superfamily II helicase
MREVGVLSRRAKLALAVGAVRSCCIVYANGARDAEKIAAEIASGITSAPTEDHEVTEFISFLEEQVHKEYGLIDTLKKRVGFHYSNMPGSVRAGVEELCARNKLKFICCTSTLLQGVNLPARDIVIENPKRGMGKPMTRGDFVNLAGRAGRLLREFHGNVWCLRPDLWEEPSYEGESLQVIQSAFEKALQDGGTAIRQVLDDDGASTTAIATPRLRRLLASTPSLRWKESRWRNPNTIRGAMRLPSLKPLSGYETFELRYRRRCLAGTTAFFLCG